MPKKHSFEFVLDKFNQRGYTLIETEYTAMTAPMRYFCPCSPTIERKITLAKLLMGRGCRECGRIKCGITRRKSHKQYVDEVKKLNPNIKIVGEYKTASNYIKVECLIDGHVWDVIANNLLRDRGCPVCSLESNESKMASKLKTLCKSKYPDTITEYKIVRNPNTGKLLSYDIYIPSLNVFIEINGAQHYNLNRKFHASVDDLLSQYERDNVKELYAVANGRYIDIDLRKISTTEEAMKLIEYGRGETSNMSILLSDDYIVDRTPIPILKGE